MVNIFSDVQFIFSSFKSRHWHASKPFGQRTGQFRSTSHSIALFQDHHAPDDHPIRDLQFIHNGVGGGPGAIEMQSLAPLEPSGCIVS